MKVKKRTVWFLTLFSLVAVISVYYYTEGNNPSDMLQIFTNGTLDQTEILGLEETKAVNSESDLFQEMRLEMSNQRSQLQEQLTQKIASEQYTPEEKNGFYNEKDALIKQESAEAMLEMLITSLGYSDALVRMEQEKVAVTVLSDEKSSERANEIIFIVKSEVNQTIPVSVDFQSAY